MSADGLDLDAIRARVDAATEGPWRRAGWCAVESEHECSNTHTCRGIAVTNGMGPAPYEQWRDQELADAEFIAHARTDVPALLAEVERLRAERDEARIERTEFEVEADAARAALADTVLAAAVRQSIAEYQDSYETAIDEMESLREGTREHGEWTANAVAAVEVIEALRALLPGAAS